VFFYFSQRFFYLKTCIENPIKSFVKHFWDHRNKLIGHSNVVYLVDPKTKKVF